MGSQQPFRIFTSHILVWEHLILRRTIMPMCHSAFFSPSNLGMESRPHACWASASLVSSTPQSFPGSFYIMKEK